VQGGAVSDRFVGGNRITLLRSGNEYFPALLAAIVAAFPALTAAEGASHHLVLATILQDASAQLIIAADVTSTANPFLGLTAGTYNGAGHQYAIEYEYDASVQKDA
jgi:hypothetical protein